jgi:hypothetical protein
MSHVRFIPCDLKFPVYNRYHVLFEYKQSKLV